MILSARQYHRTITRVDSPKRRFDKWQGGVFLLICIWKNSISDLEFTPQKNCKTISAFFLHLKKQAVSTLFFYEGRGYAENAEKKILFLDLHAEKKIFFLDRV